jgi:predicted nucleic acid-binding Zn ribbon protein
METMITMCGYCGKQYEPKRETSKFCSDACRAKSHKREKKAIAASTPAGGVILVEQPWMPTRRESVLNKLTRDLVMGLWKLEDLAEKLERCPIVEEIIAISKQATSDSFHNEVRQEVDGFDMTQRMYEWDAFEARTGLVVTHKKLPL